MFLNEKLDVIFLMMEQESHQCCNFILMPTTAN